MNEELILELYEKYHSLLKRVFDSEKIDQMFESLGDRIALCPLSHIEDKGGAPGRLVEFSLQVAQKAKSLCEDSSLIKSIIRVSLVHELGRLGSIDHNLYIEQDSSWHREKLGQTYKFNEDCPRMNIGHRSLYLLQHYGIDLSQEEWIAVLVSQGTHLDESKYYGSHSQMLSSILQYARACVS